MTSPAARANIEPRLLSREVAARYCGLSVPTFVSACPVIPIRIRSRVLYDRLKLDRWVDSLSPTGPQSRSTEDILERLDHADAR